jgi:TonB-dependent SusC/RagA subfamily outer membrane receptor
MKSSLRLKAMVILVLLSAGITSIAQTKKVTGKVIDLISGLPLAGVTITEKGTTNATASDASGIYTISVKGEASVLVFTSVAYTTQEFPVGKSSSVDARMQQSTQDLADFVAVGYTSAKKATVTGSISTIKGSEVVKSPATNVSNNLVGRLPGLSAVQPSGEPGYDGSTLRVRGVNTLRDNNMLVVVDGVPGRSLDRIDPNSIESMTILKDASAAIYGSRAANGVMLITTKRGHAGKPEINLNLNFGFNQPTRIPKMADGATYATMLNEIEYYKHYSDPSNYTPVYSDDDIQKYRDGSDPWGQIGLPKHLNHGAHRMP